MAQTLPAVSSLQTVGELVTVEPVESKAQLRRFADIPYLLHGADERWSPGVRAYESWRIDARRHPYFDRGDAAYLLARRAGRPVGRIAAHVDRSGAVDGWFGFFDVPDDGAVAGALLDAAQEWLDEQGARSMTGPVSWTPEDEFGVPVAGTEHRGLTGRPWRPSWYADQLRSAGLEPGEQRSTHRLATDAPGARSGELDGAEATQNTARVRGGGRDVPPHAGRYADPRLVLDGIAAVPDVSATLARASLRSAWRVARRASERAFDTAVCVRCTGDPAELVPALRAAAGAAGYRWLVAPWAPEGVEPETTNQVFSRRW